MTILSIQFHSHDASVALIQDGKILYASSNERFSRKKMDKGFPDKALENCLEFTKISPKKIDKVVVIGEKPFPDSFVEIIKLFTMEFFLTKGRNLFVLKNPLFVLKSIFISLFFIPAYLYKDILPLVRLKLFLKGFRGEYVFVSHHNAHLYSAYYTSGWDSCLVGCFEGGGRLKAMSLYVVRDNNWQKITECSLPNSAGIFYSISTYILGFKPLRHEGKITGLSAYGDPQKVYKLVESLLWVDGLELRVDYEKIIKITSYCLYYKKRPKEYEKYKQEDIAAAFQQRLEDCVLKIIKQVLAEHKIERIALAGGVMANVKLNQKIYELPQIKQIFIHPAMGDDGLAIGGGLHIGVQNKMKFKRLENIYFGPSYSNKQILTTLKKYGVKYKFYKAIEKAIAKLLTEGKIVARFNGRMEYGPRALGNRSILSQATDPKINQTLNAKLKRTEFMPFAPVTLYEFSHRYFLNLKGAKYAAKFMTITFNCSKEMKLKSPAVVHVDNTARPQLVAKEDNSSYYKILKEYYKITKLPTLINTSFNIHEEPIVCTPDDALRAFLVGNLDYLAIGNYLIGNPEDSSLDLMV